VAVLPFGGVSATSAQQTTGAPGAPVDATTMIDGRYLPPAPPPFGGVVEVTPSESTRSARRRAPR
jgi:hypothetical protein